MDVANACWVMDSDNECFVNVLLKTHLTISKKKAYLSVQNMS